MTAPKASRHSVAVRRTLYSSGWRLRRSAAADRGISEASSTRGAAALHRGACTRSGSNQRLEVAAPGLEVLVLVEARAGRREQDDLARPGRGPSRPDRPLEVPAASHVDRALQRG